MQTVTSSYSPAPPASGPEAVDTLARLHARTVDCRDGLARALRAAEPGLRQTAGRFRALLDRHAAALAAMLVAEGRAPSTETAAARTFVSVRPLMDEADADVTDQVRRSAGQVLAAFDAALNRDLPCTLLARLRAMRAELSDLLAETRQLA